MSTTSDRCGAILFEFIEGAVVLDEEEDAREADMMRRANDIDQ